MPFLGLSFTALIFWAGGFAPTSGGGESSLSLSEFIVSSCASVKQPGLAPLSKLGGALLDVARNATPNLLREGSPAPIDALLLASALLAGSGQLGAAREALAVVEAVAEAADAAALAAGAAAEGAPAPSPLLALLAADTLLRTGEFRAAAGVHEGLLLRAQAGGAKLALPPPRGVVGDGGGEVQRAERLARAITAPWPPHGEGGGGAAAGDAVLHAALARPPCAAALGVAAPAHPSHLTLLLSAASFDRATGRFADASRKLRAAAALLSGALRAGAGGRNASAMLPTPVRSPSASAASSAVGSGGGALALPPASCALPVLLLQQRLLQGTRRSALSVEAALGDWRWMWASGALSADEGAEDANPSHLYNNTWNHLHQNHRHNYSNGTALGDPEFPLLACGLASEAATGGWGDVARVAMSAGAGAGGAALSEWAPVLARVLRVLGPAHPDAAVALHVQGVLLREAGDLPGALFAQRSARSALLLSSADLSSDDAAGGDGNGVSPRNAAVNRSILYLRSLLHSAEMLIAGGDFLRGLRYLNTSAALVAALGAHPLSATALSLRAMISEDYAAQQLAGVCPAAAAEKGASAPPAPLVCWERAAIRAAGIHQNHYDAADAAWRALAPGARAGNADFIAFSAHHALVRARTAAANVTVLEAGVRQALLGRFNAYAHLDLGAPLPPARAPEWTAPLPLRQFRAPLPAGAEASPSVTPVPVLAARRAAALAAAPAAAAPAAESSLLLSSVALTAGALSAEGDHVSARAYLVEVNAALEGEAARGGGGSAARRRVALARAASSFSHAAVHAQWHSQLVAGKGDAATVAPAGGGKGAPPVAGTSAAARAKQRRERTRLLAAISSAADYYGERGAELAAAAGYVYGGGAAAALPGAGAPSLSPDVTVIDHAAEPTGAPAEDELASFVSRAVHGKEGRSNGGAGSGGGTKQPLAGAMSVPHPPDSFMVDPYSFDTFLGDGRGYFASQGSISLASAQASLGGSGGAPGAAAGNVPPHARANSFSSFALKNLRQVGLHMNAQMQGLNLRSMELQLEPTRRVALGLLRYGLLAHGCTLGDGEGEELTCAPAPRNAVPAAFLELFNAKALPHLDKHELLSPRGAEFLAALTEEALSATGAWDLALAIDDKQLASIRSPRLARLAALGLPVIVDAQP